MHLSEILKSAQFKITEGAEYLWNCFGPNARYLDFSGLEDQESGVSCIFDCKTQQVYQVNICTKNTKFYRWIDPDYVEALKQECVERNAPFKIVGEDNEWIELDNTADVFRKVEQIIETGDCDNEVTIDIDLDEELLLKLCLIAHERNITLNALMSEILKDAVERAKRVIEEKRNIDESK